MGEAGGGFVHRDRQRAGGQIPDELFGFDDILYAVFPAAAGKTNNRRPIVKAVKKLYGARLRWPRRPGGYPADGAWPDNRVKRVVRQAMSLRRLIEIHTTPVTKKRYPDSLIYRAAVNGYLTRLFKGDCHESPETGVTPA
jgi:hypothetical protein